MRPLKYIANLRLPTWRAHGLQIMKMCEAFADQGYDVELIVPNKTSKPKVMDSEIFEYYGVKNNFKIKKIISTDLLGSTLRFGKLFYWIDLVSFTISLFFIQDIKKEHVIYSRDSILFLPFLRKKSSMFIELHNIPVHQLFWRLIHKINGVITITDNLKERLVQNGLSEVKVIVASDGVNIREFDIKETKEKARDLLNINQDERLVVYTGSSQPWKGTETLIQAEKLIGDTKVLRVSGKLHKDIPMYLRAADILVIPNSARENISRLYTSPLKLFEYMAAKKPIIASDLPSLREIIDESTAYFFEPDNPESLAKTIEHVLLHKAEADKKALRAFSKVRNYTWEKRAKKIMEFITQT